MRKKKGDGWWWARAAGANGIKEQSERDLCSACVGKCSVWGQVMQCSRCRLRTGVAVAVPVTSTVPEADVHEKHRMGA